MGAAADAVRDQAQVSAGAVDGLRLALAVIAMALVAIAVGVGVIAAGMR